MSKKSRRRNKKILATIAALGGAAMLANRRRNNMINSADANDGFVDTEFKEQVVTTPKVYQDDIMRGGTGVKYQKPNLRFGQVIDKQGDIKTLRPFENSGLRLGIGKRKVDQTQKAVNLANKQMSEGMLPPQLQNPGRTNITTKQGENRQMFKDIGNLIFPKANFKSGRRVKKTKVTGIAKRGFGKALKKGKK